MTLADRQDVLPRSLPPRGLSRVQAAAYIGVSPTKWDELVAQGLMPQPKEIGARRIWDREEVDDAFTALPHRGAGANPFD